MCCSTFHQLANNLTYLLPSVKCPVEINIRSLNKHWKKDHRSPFLLYKNIQNMSAAILCWFGSSICTEVIGQWSSSHSVHLLNSFAGRTYLSIMMFHPFFSNSLLIKTIFFSIEARLEHITVWWDLLKMTEIIFGKQLIWHVLWVFSLSHLITLRVGIYDLNCISAPRGSHDF